MSAHALSVSGVSKVYRLYKREIDRLIEGCVPWSSKRHKEIRALNDVSFTVGRGETFGILGRNGSGKSTLLQVIAGVLQPTTGHVSVHGRIAALLELGSGFNPDFSGLDNIFLYGRILGLDDAQIQTKLDEILEFADIGDFIHEPIRTYSSGMTVRLAFSTAVSVEPDILIVDEALAVGDMQFQHKCLARMKSIIERGTTVLFVSHDIQTMKSLCSKGLLLDGGVVRAYGEAQVVADAYHNLLSDYEQQAAARQKSSAASIARRDTARAVAVQRPGESLVPRSTIDTSHRYGTGEAFIVGVDIISSAGQVTESLEYGESFTVRVFCQFTSEIPSAVIGFIVRDHRGIDVIGTNTLLEHKRLTGARAGETVAVDFTMPNLLGEGSFSITPAVTEERFFHQPHYCDWVNNACVFSVGKCTKRYVYGVFYPQCVQVTIARSEV